MILGPKLDPKSSSKFDRFLNRFFLIFGRFGEPSWGHVGDILAKNKGGLWGARVFVVAIAFSVGFPFPSFPFLDPNLATGADFGPILGRPEPILDRFWVDFWPILGCCSLLLGRFLIEILYASRNPTSPFRAAVRAI